MMSEEEQGILSLFIIGMIFIIVAIIWGFGNAVALFFILLVVGIALAIAAVILGLFIMMIFGLNSLSKKSTQQKIKKKVKDSLFILGIR